MSVTQGLNKPSQQMPGIEVELHQQINCHFELNEGGKRVKMKESYLAFELLQEWTIELFSY